ncbi:Uu.00g031550.m01.CDS01 [Anthostomella pinea]|uniref:Uu.00g031550.m01.CDS01 n=1 Tax=Anthostomella pinea TaxID=933095 RepID=A0AAI8V905_9PEZI|nr:Uu.00g031550.m01.CDS01 [Anthostomella pinea]
MTSPTKPHPPVAVTKKALYFLDNSPFGPAITSIKLNDDGTLSNPKRTLTNGVGLLGRPANRHTIMDPLFSQNSVVVDGNSLFTISPGSATVHMYTISPDDPSVLTPVGEPVPSGGTFPNSVAYSRKLGLLCVLHLGHIGGVSCFRVNDTSSEHPGLERLGDLFRLAIFQTETPTIGRTNTAGDIVFNPSQTAVFVLLKFDGVATFPGHIFAFSVDTKARKLVPAPVQSRLPGLLAPYSITFQGSDDTKAVLSDAPFLPSLEVTLAKSLTISATSAPYWTAYSEKLNIMFLLGGFDPSPVAVDLEKQEISYTITAPPETLGAFDSVVYGDY